MVNTVYNKLLPYPVPFQVDPETQSFRLLTKRKELTAFYLFMLIITCITGLMMDVVVEGLVTGSMNVPVIRCVIYLLAILLSILLILLVLKLAGKSDVVWNQYVNSVVYLERKILQSRQRNFKPKGFSMHNYLMTLKRGNLKYI